MKVVATSFLVVAYHLLCFSVMDVSGSNMEASAINETEATIFLRGRRNNDNEYENWASNVGVGGPYEKMFTPRNSVSCMTQSSDFITGLEQIKNAVAEAATAGKKLRAFGSTLSMNNMPYTKEYLLDSRELNYYKIGIDAVEHVAPTYLAKKDQLVFVQSGIMIRELNLKLLDAGLCLPASSLPDGTRFVGAVSTSAHGSQRSVGSMPNYVKAIHLVIPGDNVIVQEATDPVVTAAYAQAMGNARLVSDDDLFRAALVSFGSFGVIHGMIFEAERLFKLKYRTNIYDYETLKPVITSFNVSMLEGLDDVSDSPFYIDFLLNPYRLNKNGAAIRIHEKILINNAELETASLLASDAHDIPEMETQLKRFSLLSSRSLLKPLKKRFLGMVVQLVLRGAANKSMDGKTLYPHQINTFSGTEKRRAPIYLRNYYETEISVPHEKTIEAVELILKTLNDDPIPVVLAIRNVKTSKATIGTHLFNMTSCISVLGAYYDNVLFSGRNEEVFQKLYSAFDAQRNEIPHTYHWGKRFPINDYWVANAYGDAFVNWKAEREAFLGTNGRRMFTNELMESINMT